MESINTDATIEQTPNFLGVNATNYLSRFNNLIKENRNQTLDETSGENTNRDSHFDPKEED